MTAVGWLPADAEELFGTEATAEESYDVLAVDVPPASWLPALETARDRLDCTYFDWLSAVDEPGTGFRITAHVVALSPVRRLLLRTTVPHEAPTLPSAVGVYAGAAWHERETHEMFGVDFTGHPALDHLLLPDTFEGHPLRKDFVLAARVAKAWPGAKEPGEPEQGGPRRRQMLPPGVPDPNEWGPLKGQLPPAPSRPARGAGRAATGTGAGPAAGRAPGDRPLRRTRTAAEGSASQSAPAGTEGEGRPAPPPRRNRTVAEGSASQQAARTPEPPAADTAAQPGTPPPATPRTRRARSASEGSASQRERSTAAASGTSEEAEKAAEDTVGSAAGPGTGPGIDAPEAPAVARRTRSASEGSASQRPQTSPSKPTDERRPRRARSASEGSASRPTTPPDPAGTPDTTGRPDTTTSPDTTGTSRETEAPDRSGASGAKPSTAPRSPDAPWHNARPAHAEPEPDAAGESKAEPEAEARTEPESAPAPAPAPAPDPDPESGSSDPGAPDTPSGGPR
ncbi:NADH-quinone oxidoreductase subunit C [Streptomyces hirsutus]|uniref:NADH-quinone oxidoreductase subunit C n=1 Tax=Streptomyces hirsutus TaxID=35620 RepID=UPI00364F0156